MSGAFAVNGRFLTQRTTGVQRYAREITQALDALLAARGGGGVILAPRGVTDPPPLRALKLHTQGPGGGHAWEQGVLPWRTRLPLLNLCNLAPVARAGQVVCIHDANVFTMPGSYSAAFRAAYHTLLPLIARRAARVATVSRASAAALARVLPLQEDAFAIIPNGGEHVLGWRAHASPHFTALADARPFVLLLGSRARHKNASLILDLAGPLDALGLDVLVAGGEAGIFAGERAARAANIKPLGFVSDDDLAALLGRAVCLVFPSFVEGFGLPIVEAMALGCPVVASNASCMPEICGDAALMAAPDAPAAWLAQIARLARSRALRDEFAARGRERARAFSWAASAQAYLDLLAA